MTLIPVEYCTADELRRQISYYGLVSWSDHAQDGVEDDAVITDAIQEASQEIDMYATQRYSNVSIGSAPSLADSPLVRRWAVTLACYFLSMKRGNPPPESLLNQAERLLDPINGILVRVATGKLQLPGVPLRGDLFPAWSNLAVDRRWPISKVRVTEANSSDAKTSRSRDSSGTVLPYEP